MALARPSVLPALALGVVLAIVFFKVYGFLSRPDVPAQVASALAHFSPGVAIGRPAGPSVDSIADAQWVPNVGYVGTLNGTSPFVHARLFVSVPERSRPTGDRDAIVEGVELVSTTSDALPNMMLAVATRFRGQPVDGCIVPASEDAPHRRVQYWSTAKDRGGIAILNDWTSAGPRGSTTVFWSMMLWSGPFRGSNTLLANYDPRTCMDIVGI
jgi:hypothetical protein